MGFDRVMETHSFPQLCCALASVQVETPLLVALGVELVVLPGEHLGRESLDALLMSGRLHQDCIHESSCAGSGDVC